VGRSLAQGRRAGIVSALGISTGSLVHTVAAAAGLAALLAASPVAFGVIRWGRGGLPGVPGLGMIFTRSRAAYDVDGPKLEPSERGLPRTYAQGVLTNLLNPKVSLFFLAFLPQFIDPASSSKVASMLFLGAVFTFNGTLWCMVLALFAGEISRRIRGSPAAAGRMKKAVGAVFVGLGVRFGGFPDRGNACDRSTFLDQQD